ncbi:MAG: glycosyltransferase, partial [Planctomycetota bacterium]|nr:glycosyltransferase [Planctomycetota bacterium]
APLAAERPQLRLWIAGPEMEPEAAAELRDAILRANAGTREPWARWIGAVPRHRLRPLVERAQLVLSTSRSEGGAPNALLEASECGAVVMASDIPAHREFPGKTFLFGNDEELIGLVDRFLHPDAGKSSTPIYLRVAQRVELGRKFDAQAEAAAWDALLRRVLA